MYSPLAWGPNLKLISYRTCSLTEGIRCSTSYGSGLGETDCVAARVLSSFVLFSECLMVLEQADVLT